MIGDRWLVIVGDFHRFFHHGVTIVAELHAMALFDTRREPSDNPLSGYLYVDGTSRYGGTGMVDALRVIGGDLYVGGWFDVAGIQRNGPVTSDGSAARNLAVWHFSDPDGRWEPVGGGTDQRVSALAEVQGTLVAGGAFTTGGAVAASGVACFDPATGAWSAFGSGLGGGAGGLGHALALAQSEAAGLWVGGQFPAAGGAPRANLALWTATRAGG